jgi:hypothetical protein
MTVGGRTTHQAAILVYASAPAAMVRTSSKPSSRRREDIIFLCSRSRGSPCGVCARVSSGISV